MSTALATGAPVESRLAGLNLAGARLGYLLSAALMPAGVILDLVTQPDQAWSFLWIRLSASLVALLVLAVSYLPWASRHVVLLGAGPPLICGSGIELMILRLDSHASAYYAGLNLCILAVGVLYTWRWWQALVVSGSVVGLWLIPAIPGAMSRNGDFRAFFNNLYFLSLTAVIAVASAAIRYNAARREFEATAGLERATADLERAHSQLQQLDRFKSEFFANVTHELKTPLTMILAPLELMLQGEMGKLTEPQRTSLQSMLRNGVKLLKLIGDLLDLSKLDESRLRLQVAPHDIVGFLRDLVGQVQSLAQRKSIDMKFEANVDASMVHCDIDRLERVFVNLISNAAKFTPPGGKIRLTVNDVGSTVEIKVIDTGIGFPPDMANQLFERFFQVDRAKTRKFGGTGIGLALARELVHLHGGRITAESGGTGGATFTVELVKDRDHFNPDHVDRRARAENRATGNRATDHGVGEWQVAAKNQFRFIDIDEATDQRVLDRDADEHERLHSVLVVEDTPDVIRVIHFALRSQFRVLAARNGAQGFDLACKHSPDLIITDFMMPEMDGMAMTRKLRVDQRTRHIPVIMLTARGDLEDRVAGLEAGVNAYLMKPFSGKELVTAVRGLLKIQETTADLLLKENMDSLETIAGGLAHEINNPLNYIKNGLALIREDVTTLQELAKAAIRDEQSAARIASGATRMARMFDVAETGVRRIGATVSLMQRYSREGYTRAVQPFDVFDAARDVASMLQAGALKTRIETSFEGSGQIDCVPEELNQVLTNLIQNALDAISHDDGTVRVSGRGEETQLSLSVADNGSGIPPDARSRIFTPFYTTKDVGAGMGLGLTIVHRVVTTLGGTVNVTSNVGVGTTFTLRLPRTQSVGRIERLEAGSSASR